MLVRAGTACGIFTSSLAESGYSIGSQNRSFQSKVSNGRVSATVE